MLIFNDKLFPRRSMSSFKAFLKVIKYWYLNLNIYNHYLSKGVKQIIIQLIDPSTLPLNRIVSVIIFFLSLKFIYFFLGISEGFVWRLPKYQYEVCKLKKGINNVSSVLSITHILLRLRNDEEAQMLADILECVIFLKRLVLNLRLVVLH